MPGTSPRRTALTAALLSGPLINGGVHTTVSGSSSPTTADLKTAITEGLTEAVWQRCYGYGLSGARDYRPRKADGDCLRCAGCIDRRDLSETPRDLATGLAQWSAKYPKPKKPGLRDSCPGTGCG